MDNITIKINFTPEQQLKNELQNLLNNINKSVKLDLKLNLGDLGNQLTDIRAKLKDSFNLDGVTKSAHSSAKTLENEFKSLGEAIGRVHEQSNKKITIQNGLQEAKEINKALEEQYKLQQQINSAKNSLQSKLNNLNGSGFINTSVLQSLQNELSNISAKTPQATEKLNALKNTINNLGSGENAIVRLQNKITQMGNSLNNLKSKFGSGLINSKASNEIRAYEQQLEKLKNMLNQLKGGQSIGGATITNELNNMTNASRNLNTALQGVTTSTTTFSSRLQNGLASMGFYVSGAIAIREALNEVKEGFGHVIEVEDSLVNLRRIYEMTDEKAKSLTQTISDQALAMGLNTTTLMDLTTQWVKLGYSLEDAQNLAKQTQMFDYSADLKNTEQTATSLVSTMKGFGIVADDVNKVSDAIDTVGNNFAVNASDINEAMRVSSSALGAFGNDLNQSIAMATRLQEVIQNASTTGQSLKSIASRLTGNSTAIEAIEKVGISLDDENGKLKSTYQLIKELGEAYAHMKDNSETASWLSNLFGRQQISAGVTLLNTYKDLDAVIENIGQNEGIVQQEFEKRMNSTSAKVEQLKQTINQFWEKTISSDFTKGLIEGVTKLISTFGNLPTIISLATTALLLFKGQAITGAISGVISFASSLVTATSAVGATAVATDLLTLAMNNLKLAFATNPLGLIAVVATTAIVAFSSLHKSMQETTDDIINQQSHVEELNKTVDDLQEKQNQLNQLSSIENPTNEDKQKLIDLNNELASTYPELISNYNSETKSFEVSKEALENLIKTKRENAMMENALNFGDAKRQIEEYTKQIEEAKRQLSSGEKEIKNQFGQTEFTSSLSKGEKEKLVQTIAEAEENVSKLNQTVNQGTKYINDYIQGFVEQGKSVDQAKDSLLQFGYTQEQIDYAISNNSVKFEETTEKIEMLKKAISNITVGHIDQSSLNELNRAFPELGITMDNARDKLSDLKKILATMDDEGNTDKLRQQYQELSSAIDEADEALDNLAKDFKGLSSTNSAIDSVIEDMKKYGGITEETYGKIIDNPAILRALTAEGDVIQNLTNLQKQNKEAMEDRIQQAVDTANGVNSAQESEADSKENSDARKQQSDAETNSQIQQNTADTVDSNANNYKTDQNNLDATNSNKKTIVQSFLSFVGQIASAFVNVFAQNYTADYSNFASLIGGKLGLLARFANAFNAVKNVGSNIVGWADSKLASNGKTTLTDTFSNLKNKIFGNKTNSSSDDLKIVTDVGGSAPKMVGGTSKGSSGGGSSKKGSGGSKKSGQSEAEKWSEKINDLNSDIDIDRYASLNEQLDYLKNGYSECNNELDGMTEGTKAYYQQQAKMMENQRQQMEVQNKLKEAYKGEQSELKEKLKQYGILTDATGKLTNAEEILKKEQDKANSMKGNTEAEYNAKKKQIDAVKQLSEDIKRYRTVTEDEIPKCTQEWQKLNNEIADVQKEQLQTLKEELVAGLKKEYEKARKNKEDTAKAKYEAKKKALEEQYKKDLEDLQDEKQSIIDDYNDEIEELQKQLDALNDDSDDKNAKLASLKAELARWRKETTFLVCTEMCIGHNTYMQVNPKALHQNKKMKYAYMVWYESRKNVRMNIRLNPKYSIYI